MISGISRNFAAGSSIIDSGRKIYDGSLEHLKDTYGTTRKISMEIRQPKRLESFDLAERLGLDKTKCSMEFDPQNNILSVTFDKHLVQVPQVMNAVMEVTEVQDIQIQETELAEIVKGIYRSTGSH